MEVIVLTNEKNKLEFEVKSIDHSLPKVLSERLSKRSDVEFAAYKVEHPYLGSPKIMVIVKKGNPLNVVLEELEDIKKEIATFKKQFSSMK